MLADTSKTARIYCIAAFPLLCMRFFWHLLFYAAAANKTVITADLIRDIKQYKLPPRFKTLNFIWELRFNPYFRSLFYYRIGPSKATLCKFFAKDYSTFCIDCDSLQSMTMFHPFATIINCKRIGKNFIIRNNTTIGNTHYDYNKRPIIGDNVELGANVVIIGDITIGDNVTIGAGTVVNKNIPDNAIVVGNPFRIIRYNENS